MLETLSYKDIHQLFDVFNKVSLRIKIQIVSVLPIFLPALESKCRQEALTQLFKLVDNDPELRCELTTSDAFNEIANSLGEDHQSKMLLLLSLYSRGLFSLDYGCEFALDFIHNDERWSWVLDKVPEYLDTTHGMEAMLDDPACRTQMINYLDKSFLECSDTMRLSICKKMLEFHPKLRKCRDGEKFVDQLIHWFLRSPDFFIAENGPLNSRFISLLTKHLALYKISFGKSEKNLLTEKLSKVIGYAIRVNAFDQSTSILIEIAKIDKKLINDLAVIEWTKKKTPDAILLFGTGILSDEWLDKFESKIINLHLGHSPRYRGSATNSLTGITVSTT
jgi:hypothetical protein